MLVFSGTEDVWTKQGLLFLKLRHAEECHFYVKDVTFSPIRGPEGNIEYLGQLTVAEQPPYTGDLAALVEESHKRLEGNEP